MTRTTLSDRIQAIVPHADEREVARTCLLLTNACEAVEMLNDEQLKNAWREVRLKLQLATDQHAAMTLELEQLAESDPGEFKQEQVWILLRAIKVQSQVLELYLGQPALDI